MDARKLVEHISQNDQRLAILRALRERPGTPSDLADRVGVERTPVYTALEALEQCGAVVSLDGRRKLTAAGDIAVCETADACETLNREAVAYLAASASRLSVLEGLSRSLGRSELMRGEEWPSRSTVKRTIEDCEAFGWISAGPNYEVTETGEDVYETYVELHRRVGIVVEKLPYLRHVDPARIDLPIDLMTDAEVVQSLTNRPNRADERTRKRMGEEFDHAKLFTSYYSESEVVALLESGRNGATWESVSPLPAHMPLPTSTTEILHIKECLTAEGGSWQTYPDVLPLDLAIFDNERVLLGANKELKTGHHDAILDSTNPALIAWADELYESYRKDASGPLEYLFGPIKENKLYEALPTDLLSRLTSH